MQFLLLALRLLSVVLLAVAFAPSALCQEGTASSDTVKRSLVDQDEQDVPSPLYVEGTVRRNRFPSDNGAQSTGQADDEVAKSRLNAIITKSQTSAWQRYFALGQESFDKGKYEDAQKYFLLAVRELKKTNTKDQRLILSRNNLGEAYLAEAQYLDAQDAFELAQQTERELSLLESPEGARTLKGLATVYQRTGKLVKAEQLFKDAIKLRESVLGPNNPAVAESLIDLGEVYRYQKLFTEAEPIYRLALEIYNKSSNVPELKIAYALEKAGSLFYDQGKLEEANKLFGASLDIKDKHSTPYTQTDPHNLSLVYYRCLNGIPNSYHAFTRGVEAEFINVKDVSCVATLTAQIFGSDWYLLKAQVTVHNNGKTPISALSKIPTLKIESPKVRYYTPLDSDAIATELGARGSALANHILHSADFDFIADSIVTPGVLLPNWNPLAGGLGVNIVPQPFAGPSWVHYSPNWQARVDARNRAMLTLAQSQHMASTIAGYKPVETTIGPGETDTFLIYFPYCKFTACTLRIALGNTILEFPFTDRSG